MLRSEGHAKPLRHPLENQDSGSNELSECNGDYSPLKSMGIDWMGNELLGAIPGMTEAILTRGQSQKLSPRKGTALS